ncbi:hypothetical protein BN2537_669 [Streptomyces venezuelae]|nr:hypothetical protein BN2537_669 [Streptomyces venezuelae]
MTLSHRPARPKPGDDELDGDVPGVNAEEKVNAAPTAPW